MNKLTNELYQILSDENLEMYQKQLRCEEILDMDPELISVLIENFRDTQLVNEVIQNSQALSILKDKSLDKGDKFLALQRCYDEQKSNEITNAYYWKWAEELIPYLSEEAIKAIETTYNYPYEICYKLQRLGFDFDLANYIVDVYFGQKLYDIVNTKDESKINNFIYNILPKSVAFRRIYYAMCYYRSGEMVKKLLDMRCQ